MSLPLTRAASAEAALNRRRARGVCAVMSRWCAVTVLLWLGACATQPLPSGNLLPSVPGGGRCRLGANQSSPLVTEWPASEKANLEALLRSGGVAVAFSGCTLKVIPGCRVASSYSFQRTTPSTDVLEIENENDLWTKLPIGAATLEGELKRTGKLAVRTMVAGQMKLEPVPLERVAADEACANATHVVGALAVGAFELSSGGQISGHATAGFAGLAGARAGASRSAGLLRSAGDPQSCGQSTVDGPHPNCASPLQAFLWPLPGRVLDEAPPGSVRADFLSGDASSRWDVYVDDRVVCTTPCSGYVRPERPVMLRTREDGPLGPSDRVQLASLFPHAADGPVQVAAHPTSRGKLVTGITFTAFGGMAAITGVALSGIGCSRDRAGMCKAGMISLGVGAVVTAASVWLILDSFAHAELSVPGQLQVRVSPAGISGVF